MKELIEVLKLQGFRLPKDHTNDDRFYMSSFISSSHLIDVDCDDKYCKMRLIGISGIVEVFETKEPNNIDIVVNKIKQWKLKLKLNGI